MTVLNLCFYWANLEIIVSTEKINNELKWVMVTMIYCSDSWKLYIYSWCPCLTVESHMANEIVQKSPETNPQKAGKL